MRVAVVLPFNSFVEVNMSKAFEKVGIDCWFVTSEKQRFDYRGTKLSFEKYEKTLELPCILANGLLMQYAPFPIMPNLVSAIRQLNVDVLSVSEHNSQATWMFASYKKGWKTVLTEHGNVWISPRDKIYNFLTKRFVIRHLDGFVGIGLKSKAFLENMGARAVSVIPNPINCELFKPSTKYEERENNVLYVGKVDTYRKLHVAIKAMKIVKEKIKNAKLCVIGAEGNLSRYVNSNNDIEYLGVKPHIEMPKYYNSAKVFIDPRDSRAGCGCATSEALACGTPIVGNKCLDFPFVWKNGESGYLVEEDATSLANAVVEVLLDGNRMHESCRKLALEEFSHESVGRRYLKVFEQALDA